VIQDIFWCNNKDCASKLQTVWRSGKCSSLPFQLVFYFFLTSSANINSPSLCANLTISSMFVLDSTWPKNNKHSHEFKPLNSRRANMNALPNMLNSCNFQFSASCKEWVTILTLLHDISPNAECTQCDSSYVFTVPFLRFRNCHLFNFIVSVSVH
jgi:hypothetical protein